MLDGRQRLSKGESWWAWLLPDGSHRGCFERTRREGLIAKLVELEDRGGQGTIMMVELDSGRIRRDDRREHNGREKRKRKDC